MAGTALALAMTAPQLLPLTIPYAKIQTFEVVFNGLDLPHTNLQYIIWTFSSLFGLYE